MIPGGSAGTEEEENHDNVAAAASRLKVNEDTAAVTRLSFIPVFT